MRNQKLRAKPQREKETARTGLNRAREPKRAGQTQPGEDTERAENTAKSEKTIAKDQGHQSAENENHQ